MLDFLCFLDNFEFSVSLKPHLNRNEAFFILTVRKFKCAGSKLKVNIIEIHFVTKVHVYV